MALTAAQRRGLSILRDHGPLMPKDFAEKMWPDSEGWQRQARCGYGVHPGGGMYTAAGGYLGKLRGRGWVRRSLEWHVNKYVITKEGLKALSATAPGGER